MARVAKALANNTKSLKAKSCQRLNAPAVSTKLEALCI